MRIALVGYDVEGQASYRFFSKDNHEIVIFDEAESPRAGIPEGVELISGTQALDKLKSMEFDKVLRTPGLSPKKLEGVKNVTSATREFFQACPAPIIGVTGTKGKGTTASLIRSMLTAAGKKSWLVGNIGTPALDVLPEITKDDIVVYEMSSFQLWDLDKSPHIAVVLMIEPDHLDVHSGMDDYINAKTNIRRHQTADDFCYYNGANEFSTYIALETVVEELQDNAYTYGDSKTSVVYSKENTFFMQNDPICSTDVLNIVGRHNIENACAAISAVRHYVTDKALIAKGLQDFEGLPHRIKFIRELDGVEYYDDNYSSAPGATLAAVKSFQKPEVLILGGYDKGVDFTELATSLSQRPNIKRILLMGRTRHALAEALSSAGMGKVFETMDETTLAPIVQRAKDIAEKGDVVIMSPGCASFDMFKNFADRGDQFVEIVKSF